MTYPVDSQHLTVLGGILASLTVAVSLFVFLKYISDTFDKSAFIFFLICIGLLWLIPAGIFLLLPLAVIASLSSPASRQEWKSFKKNRIISIFIFMIVINLFAFYPVSVPNGSADWGEPIATENPYAPSWPAREQYTWFYDGAVISVVNVRTPHTFSQFGQSSSSINLGILLDVHEQRMQQSIEVMNEQIPGFSIDPTSFTLTELRTEGSYEYADKSYFVARFELKREGFETTIGTVLVVGIPDFGGEMSVLSITRSTLFSSDDIFEENLVNQYLQSG